MANILLVDNSAVMRRSLKSLLTHAGHKVVAEAEDVAGALYEYNKHKPDLVIVELRMRVVNGAELTRELLRVNSKARILITCTEDDGKLINEAMRNGAKNYIPKPINPEELHRIFYEILPKNLIPKKDELKITKRRIDTSDSDNESSNSELPPFDVEIHKKECIIKISKNLKLENALKLQSEIDEILEEDIDRITIDFGNTHLLDDEILEKLGESIIKIKSKLGAVNLLSIEASMKDKLERQISHAF